MVTREDRPMSVPEMRTQVNMIQEVIKSIMKPDVHYGIIPGTKKNTLYKPGAEVILTTFRIAVEPSVEDLSGLDERRYRVRATGVHQGTGIVVGTGIGECSTNEEKYKWRGAVCDEEYDATPEDCRRVVWKKGREKAYSVKQVRTNPADLANTALKMAKKRAMIDLTLTCTAASDCFEQDLEELPEEYRASMGGEQQSASTKPTVQPPQRKSEAAQVPAAATTPTTSTTVGDKISENQKRMLWAKSHAKGLKEEILKDLIGVEHLSDILKADLDGILRVIDGWQAPVEMPPADELPFGG